MAFNFQGNQMPMGMGGQGQIMGGPPMIPGQMMPVPMNPMMGMFPQMGPLQPPLPANPGGQMGPGMNDQPLEFNTTKNQPPILIASDINESSNGSKSVNDKNRAREARHKADSVSSSVPDQDWDTFGSKQTDTSNSDMGSGGGDSDSKSGVGVGGSAMGPWPSIMPYQMMGMPPIMDPSMIMPQYGMMGGVMGNEVQKEIIQLKSVSLVPPPPGVPPPATRERPPGCKTIFVGGLAETATEEILREIFERCGEIISIRLSSKKFCHIRFMHEQSVDAALFFSGYRMRVENKTDAVNTGRLHVDFAQARDDQYEWECKQRALQRQARHREKVEKERFRVPSPPPVPHYTDTEAASVADKIKSEGFGQAVQVVITWLERGDCNKRNSSVFYSMIQSTNSHIRRLLQEKATYEEELMKAKDLMKARIQTILLQYAQIERVFVAASHKKVWDHFTKAQRKNIEMWSKQAAEIKTVELEEHLNCAGNDEMDVSSDEETPKKKNKSELTILKEENDGLKCQVEAYKNEVDLVKGELRSEIDLRDSRLKVAQQTIQNMQQKLAEANQMRSKEEVKVRELKSELLKLKDGKEGEVSTTGVNLGGTQNPMAPVSAVAAPSEPLPEQQATLIGMICLFLHVHPFGASVDYLWSYLEKLAPGLRNSDIEAVLYAYPTIFQQEVSGVGANVERKWILKLFPTPEVQHPII